MDPARRGHRRGGDGRHRRTEPRPHGKHHGAGAVDRRLREHHVHDVVGDDGRHDAAERDPYSPALRAHQPKGKIGRSPLYSDRDFRGRLFDRLGSVQRGSDRPAMGVRATRPAVADDGDDKLLARRRDPARRRRVAVDADQRHLLAALPLTDGLFRAELAAWLQRCVSGWG